MMERSDAEDFYREKVLRLLDLGCVYSFDYPEPEKIGRRDFGLEENDVVFVSPQSTFKYVPQDDDLYPAIALRIGERCKFVFIARADASSVLVFENRLKAAFERHGLSYDRHVTFVKRQLSNAEFIALFGMSDVFLDNPGWSGRNTTLDALHGKTLVLSIDGKFMRQRHAAAIMRYLGFPELIARDKAQLIDLCEKYASNAGYKDEYRKSLSQRIGKLAGKDCVSVFENFAIDQLKSTI